MPSRKSQTAVVYHPPCVGFEGSDLVEPLISPKQISSSTTISTRTSTTSCEETLDPILIGKLKWSCLVLGVLIGFFIQVSTIGASFLTNLPWAKGATGGATTTDGISTTDPNNSIAGYALAWSIITATASCGVMMIFRSFVEITFNLTLGRNLLKMNPETYSRVLDELVWYFECYFSLGVLISVTLAWIATSFVLGMPSTLIDMAITVALPVFWCVSFFVIFLTKEVRPYFAFSSRKKNNKKNKKRLSNKKASKQQKDKEVEPIQVV